MKSGAREGDGTNMPCTADVILYGGGPGPNDGLGPKERVWNGLALDAVEEEWSDAFMDVGGNVRRLV